MCSVLDANESEDSSLFSLIIPLGFKTFVILSVYLKYRLSYTQGSYKNDYGNGKSISFNLLKTRRFKNGECEERDVCAIFLEFKADYSL